MTLSNLVLWGHWYFLATPEWRVESLAGCYPLTWFIEAFSEFVIEYLKWKKNYLIDKDGEKLWDGKYIEKNQGHREFVWIVVGREQCKRFKHTLHEKTNIYWSESMVWFQLAKHIILYARVSDPHFFCGSGSRQKFSCGCGSGSGSWGYPGEGAGGKGKNEFFFEFLSRFRWFLTTDA